MPLSPRHKQQRGKNYLILLILIAMVVMLFALSYVKFTGLAVPETGAGL
ncbi:MAG: hypothetical protein ACPG80_01390 [Rickettsiales bacterium]